MTKDVKMHHCIISLCLLFLHCITPKQRCSFLSLSISCSAGRATTKNHTCRHTHSLCLFLSSVSPPAQTLCTHTTSTLWRRGGLCWHCTTHILLSDCVAPPLFLPERLGWSVRQSACLSTAELQSGGFDWYFCEFILIRVGPELVLN